MVSIPLYNSTVVTFPLGLPDQNVTGLMDTVPLQQAPTLRGAASIILSCATVLIIAFYSSLHPDNIDEQDWSSSTFFAFLMMLAPELWISHAAQEYIKAQENTTYFKNTLKLTRWTRVHSFVLEMNLISLSLQSGISEKISSREQLGRHVRNGVLRDEDLPTVQKLKDLGKADTLVKVLTVLQVLWLLIQCLARWLSHLPVSLLELMTSCYAICAVFAYFFWMDKPYRADSRPCILLCSGTEDECLEDEDTCGLDDMPLVNTGSYAIVAFILSAIHFSAWNSVFPTNVEQKLWKITSICHVSAVGSALAIMVLEWTAQDLRAKKLSGMVIWLPSLSRLLLIGLSIASLRAMPAGVYIQPAWMSFIPHFG
ncbi:hypothetical protein DL96DRAFT_1822096 [Flagelloscypha sp. PMI_526]|nr:hypothetical protein DL96DRAFT_1822096 [Flagelloscypha sp. PMI_526]